MFFLGTLIATHAESGDAWIKLGKNKIGQNQAFTITLSIENEYIKTYSDFPEIKGLKKMGTSSSTNTTIVNGKMTVISSVTQNYYPSKQGKFNLKSFTMQVNGKEASSEGTTIEVGEPVQRRRRQDPFAWDWDPFEDMQNPQELEYVDIEADAFLAVTTDKKEVYKGEGFNTTISFFVAESNKAHMDWPGDLYKQIETERKKIKPSSSWEEKFNIKIPQKKRVKLKGKVYDQFILYQSTFFPLVEDDILIPSISLTLIKYKAPATRTFFGRAKRSTQEFKSTPKYVKVKPLPFHPLKESVSVGNYELKENIQPGPYNTGQSFSYNFTIRGTGNIAAIQLPDAPKDEFFDFYEPEILQNIQRKNNRVSGTKTFQYFAEPKEPGKFTLGNYFTWIYFDPRREVYDTLSSDIFLQVSGKSRKNTLIRSSDLGDFYDRIDIADNTLADIRTDSFPYLTLQIITALVLLISLYFFFKR